MNISNLNKHLFYRNLYYNQEFREIINTLNENDLADFCRANDDLLTSEDFSIILLRRKLSEKFLREFFDKCYSDYISALQNLSETFIEDYADRLDWECISFYQTLSEDFIEKHKDKVIWPFIFKYQSLSKEFIKKYQVYV